MVGKEITNELCTGCGACAAICPVDAIILKENENGFREPVVNPEKCINCALCEKTCREQVEYRNPQRVYLARHKTEEVHKDSQSGGAFTAISDYILSKNGIIYGAVFNDTYEVVHIRATSVESRNKMRGSKYIQSNMDTIYKQIENDLNYGRLVLFVGTGCQVAGILKFFKNRKTDITNLFTVDILCHGVPSVFIWRDTLRYLKKTYNANISSVQLKEIHEKTRPVMYIKLGEKGTTDYLYRKLYYSNLALRKSCYSCKYNSCQRVGDITIGDAWGIEKANPEFNDKRGVSLILFNSEKALKGKDSILQDMVIKNVSIKDYMQKCMISPAKPKREPALFWNDYHNKQFGYIIEKYAKHNLLLNIPYIFKRMYQKILRCR